MEKVTVRLPARPRGYDILIGYGFLDRACGMVAAGCRGARLAVVTDSNVKRLYGNRFVKGLRAAGAAAELFAFPAGERSKTRETKARLEDQMLASGLGRDSAVIALGGGVVGDLAGFLAATYMRGVPYVQVPTTVVAQGDSSIGGKTAVDTPAGKNLIGAFYQPRGVYVDVKTLETLDDKNYRTGLTEVIKHGIIRDRAFFEFIGKNLETILSRRSNEYPRVMAALMARNCGIKNAIVTLDETEQTGLRKVLNYGHTVGHAVETLSGFSMAHGEAVSIGIACEAFMSWRLGHCSRADYEKQVDLFEKVGLPTSIPREIRTGAVVEKMRLDKKARGSQAEFVLLERIGKTVAFGGRNAAKIPEPKLLRLLGEFRNARG